MAVFKTTLIFLLAGIFEISGGYLIWLSVKEGKSYYYGIAGSIILILYGFVATFQSSNFARVYATYGGYFIILSLVWAYFFDKFEPDKFDLIGALIVLIGVSIIYYAPRN